MKIENLHKIGLSNQESKALVTLFELGSAKTGQICSKAKIPRSNVYLILDSLIEKGLVSSRIENNIQVFFPNSIEAIENFVSQKQNTLDEAKSQITADLTNLEKIRIPTSVSYKYFEGINGIKSMWFEILANSKPGMKAVNYTASQIGFERLNAFYVEMHKKRVARKVSLRMILPRNSKQFRKERKNLGLFDSKEMTILTKGEFGVFGNYVFLQHIVGKEPKAFLLNDKIFAETFTDIFDKLWNSE